MKPRTVIIVTLALIGFWGTANFIKKHDPLDLITGVFVIMCLFAIALFYLIIKNEASTYG